MTTTSIDPVSVPCPRCLTRPGKPCRDGRGALGRTHVDRLTLARLAADNPVRKHRGQPVAKVLRVYRDGPGPGLLVILCPLCWSEHVHGLTPRGETEYTDRAPHCRGDYGPGYWIPSTGSIESTSTSDVP